MSHYTMYRNKPPPVSDYQIKDIFFLRLLRENIELFKEVKIFFEENFIIFSKLYFKIVKAALKSHR